MYVTDVPVMDRITNPIGLEVGSALALFEDMAADLCGAADGAVLIAERALECDDIECDEFHAKDMDKALEHLSGCAESVLAAQESIREALALLDIQTL